MRNRALHDALKDFAVEASAVLSSDVAAGAELAFEVAEEPGSGAVLYRYRALTGEFIGARWEVLRTLGSCARAADLLGSGAAGYLRVEGHRGVNAEPALRAMLERLYDEATTFDFPAERFETVYGGVERRLFEDSVRALVVAPIHGLAIASERVDLGDGLLLVPRATLDAPVASLSPIDGDDEADDRSGVLCVLERTIRTGAPTPLADARIAFRRVLCALRLLRPGPFSLAPVGWSRADDGAWQPLALEPAGRRRGFAVGLDGAEESELRELATMLGRSRAGGTISWALARFEMGCERGLEIEALSDYLLALRALLDASDDTGQASLSLRLAALCADERDRRSVQRRVESAFALERFVIRGGSGGNYVETIGSQSPQALVEEVESHLRAILRDVLCGYLDSNLKGLADDILLDSGEPFEIRARDTRPAADGARAERGQVVPEPSLKGPDRANGGGARDDLHGVSPEDDVTPSADWGSAEDAASYSAPV